MKIVAQFTTLTFAVLLSPFSGCKSSDTEGQYAEGIVYPVGTDTTIGAAPNATGHSKIIIKSAKPGTRRSVIATAIMAATRKLGQKTSGSDPAKELQLANDAAQAILDGDEVILESSSPEVVASIALDLQKAGLIVTTAK